tara:strand:- start:510 stop:806 length:297 start_codon:yes stop_codon:yes gene_type:complete
MATDPKKKKKAATKAKSAVAKKLKRSAPPKRTSAPVKTTSSQQSTIQKRYPKHSVRQLKGSNRYSLTDSQGHSVTMSPGKKQKPAKTIKQAIKIKNKK